MRLRKAGVVLVAVVIGLLATACEGRVPDPVGDGTDGSFVDIVQAGVDYRSQSTRLWITFAPRKAGVLKRWGISTNGDTTEEFVVRLGDVVNSDPDRYEVTGTGEAVDACAGFVSDGGAVGNDTYEVRFHSKCLRSGGTGGLPPESVRFIAYSESYRTGSDTTTWSNSIPVS
jgi:hypothetical protein